MMELDFEPRWTRRDDWLFGAFFVSLFALFVVGPYL